MKRTFLFLLALLIAVPIVFAEVQVSVIPPSVVRVNESANFKIIVSSNENLIDIAQVIPAGWTIDSWNTEGVLKENVVFETKAVGYLGKASQAYHWSVSSPAIFNLTFSFIPTTSGEQNISTIWVYPGGFESKETSLNVMSTVCGNYICESAQGENSATCPADCRPIRLSPLWIILLVIATFITIAGTAYREYLKYWLKKPSKHIKRHIKHIIHHMRRRK